jgi:thiosulfate/3-mercaptopyruvate sulfurtransferase
MAYTTLISTAELAAHLNEPAWAVVDCRFSLVDAEKGRRDYRAAHIAGAVYAHLDEHLSGPIVPGRTGRHPLPAVATFSRTLSAWGIGPETQVVVYDDGAGVWAGRLWWMLRWLGHDAVAVLDGDWRAWVSEGRSTRSGDEARAPSTFTPHQRPHLLATTEEIAGRLGEPSLTLVDVRVPERYRGEVEPIDPVAGHIPGARSIPFALNTGPDGRFLSPEELRARYATRLAGAAPEECIFYCGSGVSAVHGLLALRHAGLGDGRLYVGSWSEWIADRVRPIETGEEKR